MPNAIASPQRATYKDYLELTKPKVVLLMLLTAVVGMLLASPPDVLPIKALTLGLIGIGFSAGSAAIINHLVDKHIDTQMKRTQARPVATGRIEPKRALMFSFVLGLIGLGLLAVCFNPLSAWLTFISLVGYAVIYTIFLKHSTPQNIVIGGLAGAAPPLLGWVTVTGTLDANALLLVLIIFAWTPPHFWALAVYRFDDYKKAQVPMLPVTHGIKFTKLNIVLYTILMVISTVLPFVSGLCGWVYLISALILGVAFMAFSLITYQSDDKKYAFYTFLFSIFYLMGLFISLILDHYVLFWLEKFI